MYLFKQPQIGADYSPVGQIYFYTLKSTNPGVDLMDLKSLEDWTLEKQFKSVPNIVDVVSFGGITKEYQVRIDPTKLIQFDLTFDGVMEAVSRGAHAAASWPSFHHQRARGPTRSRTSGSQPLTPSV